MDFLTFVCLGRAQVNRGTPMRLAPPPTAEERAQREAEEERRSEEMRKDVEIHDVDESAWLDAKTSTGKVTIKRGTRAHCIYVDSEKGDVVVEDDVVVPILRIETGGNVFVSSTCVSDVECELMGRVVTMFGRARDCLSVHAQTVVVPARFDLDKWRAEIESDRCDASAACEGFARWAVIEGDVVHETEDREEVECASPSAFEEAVGDGKC